MKKLKIISLILFAVLAAANAAVWLTGTTYIYKALLHQKPNIDDLGLFPHRTVKAAPSPQPLPLAEDYNKTALPAELRSVLEQYQSVAFLVLQHGRIRYEEYWEDYSPLVNSNSFSAVKSIVSILVGIAQDKGYIKSLDQPVGEFLPEFREGPKSAITIRDVLRMASGLNFDEAYNKPFSNTTDAYYGKDLKKLINSLEVVEKPGTVYYYRSGDTLLLGIVLEAATGMSLSAFAQQYLWEPMGAEHDAQWSLDREEGMEKAYCCFYSNARDFARVGFLYLNQGRANGLQIAPQSYIRESLEPIMLPDRQGAMVDYYGYQWWLYHYQGEKIFYARGILGQYIFVAPGRDMVVVRLGRARSPVQVGGHPEDVHAIIRGFMETF